MEQFRVEHTTLLREPAEMELEVDPADDEKRVLHLPEVDKQRIEPRVRPAVGHLYFRLR